MVGSGSENVFDLSGHLDSIGIFFFLKVVILVLAYILTFFLIRSLEKL
jgi:hypothetical protein